MKHQKLKTMRVWELRDHGYSDEMRKGYRTNMREYEDAHEAYECGYEDGYEEAMEEMEGHMDHRSNYRTSYRMGERRGRKSMR